MPRPTVNESKSKNSYEANMAPDVPFRSKQSRFIVIRPGDPLGAPRLCRTESTDSKVQRALESTDSDSSIDDSDFHRYRSRRFVIPMANSPRSNNRSQKSNNSSQKSNNSSQNSNSSHISSYTSSDMSDDSLDEMNDFLPAKGKKRRTKKKVRRKRKRTKKKFLN